MNKLIFEQTFALDYIPSVNNYLMPKRGGGVMMTPEVRNFKSEIQTQIEGAGTPFNYSGDKGIVAVYAFILKCSYLKRDLDNMIKCLQDAVFQNYGWNDSAVVQITTFKLFKPSSDREYIKVKLEESNFDFKQFSII